MTTIYFIRHSAPFVEIDNYQDYENVLWSEYNRNMILSVKGEDGSLSSFQTRFSDEIIKLKIANNYYTSH